MGGQTGEGSGTGRISVGEAVLELRESSVSIERPHSLSLAETEWGERIYIEGAQVKVVELVRSAWQAGEQENQERTMTRGGRLTIE